MRSGSDFLQLDRGAAPARGLVDWLTGQLRSAVAGGHLAAGAALPSTRTLADELGVSRGTVVEAYRRLTEEGLTVSRTGDGTRVLPRPTPAVPPPPRAVTRAGASPGRLPLPPSPDVELDLSPGVPDLSAFPRAAWLRAERAVLTSATAADLGYGDPRGSAVLRTAVAGWLARTRGIRVLPEHVLVVAGVAQTLALLSQVLTARGRTTIAVEDPGSRGARDALRHWGTTPLPVPVDDDGIRVDALAGTGAHTALITPAHQFPTGVLLAPDRRRQLVDWARAGHLVVEDDYDAEHRYDRPPSPALHASAPEHVVHTGSASKTLAPGIRLGWLIAPAHLRDDLLAARHASDLGSPALPQLVLADLMASGVLERHLRTVRRRQRARRDALVAALAEHLPTARVHGIAAGLHLLVTLPDGTVPDTVLADRAARAGLRVHPLSWHRQLPGPPGLVLGYAAHTPDRLRVAARLLAATLTTAGVG